jgi:ABC-type sulfate/molybdate transport systems ATPase subunit
MNQTFILVTHDPNIANMTRNVVQMLDGRILETTRPSKEEPTEQASLKTQRKLLLSEMEWLKKSLRLEEQWIEKKPEAYNDAVTEYTKRWKRLKQSLREIGLEEV